MLAAAANATVLRVFFSFLLLLLVAAGFYIWRNRDKFFVHCKEEGEHLRVGKSPDVAVILV